MVLVSNPSLLRDIDQFRKIRHLMPPNESSKRPFDLNYSNTAASSFDFAKYLPAVYNTQKKKSTAASTKTFIVAVSARSSDGMHGNIVSGQTTEKHRRPRSVNHELCVLIWIGRLAISLLNTIPHTHIWSSAYNTNSRIHNGWTRNTDRAFTFFFIEFLWTFCSHFHFIFLSGMTIRMEASHSRNESIYAVR